MTGSDDIGEDVAPSAARWMGLRWTAWMPLMAAHPLALAQLPSGAGVYRLRRVDEGERVVGVYPATRGVRETVERLSRQVHLTVEPYDDPVSPARVLWDGRRCGFSYEVSGAPIPHSEDVPAWVERLATIALTSG